MLSFNTLQTIILIKKGANSVLSENAPTGRSASSDKYNMLLFKVRGSAKNGFETFGDEAKILFFNGAQVEQQAVF